MSKEDYKWLFFTAYLPFVNSDVLMKYLLRTSKWRVITRHSAQQPFLPLRYGRRHDTSGLTSHHCVSRGSTLRNKIPCSSINNALHSVDGCHYLGICVCFCCCCCCQNLNVHCQVLCVFCDHNFAQTWKTAWGRMWRTNQLLLFSDLIEEESNGIG